MTRDERIRVAERRNRVARQGFAIQSFARTAVSRASGLTATLDAATGGLTLRWKTKNPPNARRTTYIIRRRIMDEAGGTREGIPGGVGARSDSRTSEFQFIGVSGTKRFVDDTLVVGARVRDPVTPVASRAGGIHAPATTLAASRAGECEKGFSHQGERRGKGFPQEWVREGILAPGILAPAVLAPVVQYTVQGQRANLSGPVSPIFNVNFGKAASKSKGENRKSRIESRQSKGES